MQKPLRFKKSHFRNMTAASASDNIKSLSQNGKGRAPVPAASLLGHPVPTIIDNGSANTCVHWYMKLLIWGHSLARYRSSFYGLGASYCAVALLFPPPLPRSHFFLLLRNPALSSSPGDYDGGETGFSCSKKMFGLNTKEKLLMWERSMSIKWRQWWRVTLDQGEPVQQPPGMMTSITSVPSVRWLRWSPKSP